MPRTRSPPAQEPRSRLQPQDRASSRKPLPKSRRITVQPEIIVISSDDDGPVPPKRRSKKIGPSKAIKIPSEDDGLGALRTKIRELEENNRTLTEELSELKAEAAQLRAVKNPLDLSSMEDHITCRVCALKMWNPYMLPDCGHTFCETCLQDWFGTTLAKHMRLYPQYNANQPLPLRSPQPRYTCPACREEVKRKPVQDYNLKALVRTVAKAGGEISPQKLRHDVTWQTPWGNFFPPALGL